MKNDLEREVKPLIGQWTGHGDGIDVAKYAGSYADYRITKQTNAQGQISYRVIDKRASVNGNEGADTLTNVEKIAFADLDNVDLSLNKPLPVADILSTNSAGQNFSRTGSHLISKAQLLANDSQWNPGTAALKIKALYQGQGGTATLTAAGDVLFTPNSSYTGVMGFSYSVELDGVANSSMDVGSTYSATVAPMRAAVYLTTDDLKNSQGQIDPLMYQQWYLGEINAMGVWTVPPPKAAQTIGVRPQKKAKYYKSPITVQRGLTLIGLRWSANRLGVPAARARGDWPTRLDALDAANDAGWRVAA
jgi:hypothetical protein